MDLHQHHTDLISLATGPYSATEAQRAAKFQFTPAHFDEIGRVGKEVQSATRKHPGACRYWTALWVTRVRNELDLPVVQVGGDLYAHDECVYGPVEASAALQDPASSIHAEPWRGHSWMAMGDWIGDISITHTTLMQDGCHPALRDVVKEHFTNETGTAAMVGVHSLDRQRGLLYVPKVVFSPAIMQKHIEVGIDGGERPTIAEPD